MSTKKVYIMLLLFVVLLLGCSQKEKVVEQINGPAVNSLNKAVSNSKFVEGTVPHFYEFDSVQNPNKYYWCGHASLKMVAEYISLRKNGKANIKTLSQLHETFKKNSPNGYATNTYVKGLWAANLMDLDYAARLTQNNGYGLSDGRLSNKDISKLDVNKNPNYSFLFQKMKDGVNLNYPPIVSTYTGNLVGHFMVVVGYEEKTTVENSILYIRDCLYVSPVYKNYEHSMTVKDFYQRIIDGDKSNNINRDYIQLVYVK